MPWQYRVSSFFICAQILVWSWAMGAYSFAAITFNSLFAFCGFIVLWTPGLARENFKLLRRYPVFYFGLAFLLYIFLQYLNPAYAVAFKDKSWHLQPVDNLTWLPSSIESPFGWINPMRVFMVVASAWVCAMSVYLVVRTRRSFLFFCWFLTVNGFLFAVLSIVQKLAGTAKYLGIFTVGPTRFLGSFIYHNHGAAFAYLTMSVTLGLFIYLRKKVLQGQKRSGPEMLLLFFLMVEMFHVAFIHSRAALIILALIFLCACALLIRQERKYSSNTLRTTLVYIFLITLIPVSILSAQKSGMKFNIDRFSEIDADWSNAQSNVRYHLIQGTKDMFLDKPLYGWGAGSFVYAFPIYQAKSDFLKNDGQKIDNLYTNAHSDLIQMFAEYGVVGAIILFSAIFYFYFQCWKKRKDLTSVQLMIWLGCIFLIIHSGYEFIFQCPSLLFIFAFMNALLYRSVRYSSNASTDFSNSRKSSS